MSEGKPFPLNAWYAAAWSHEIKHELAARTICDKDVVLYRRADGAVAALEDACWHRLLPLSLGRLKDDEVVCGYHGLVFNSAGRCTYMPAQKTINPSAAVHAYPTIERHRLVWIWPGDPALADPAKMPDFHWNDGTDWVGEGGTFYKLGCDYRLVVDNLMDLTHETYVHVGSIGDEAITGTPFEVSHTDHTATVTRWMIDIDPPPFWASAAWQTGQCRPLADHLFSGAVGHRRRRRRCAHRNGRSARRSLAGRQRGIPRRDHAGDGARPVIISGTSFALSGKMMRSSPVKSTAPTSTTARASTIRT